MDIKKNPKIIALLLVLVIGLWSVIFYKIFSYEAPRLDTSQKKTNKAKNDSVADPSKGYELLLDYSDPFVCKASTQFENNSSITSNQNVNVIDHMPRAVSEKKIIKTDHKPSVVKMPDVIYGGIMVNKSRDKKVAILKFTTDNRLLGEGQSYQGVSVVGIYNDSVRIDYADSSWVINKTK